MQKDKRKEEKCEFAKFLFIFLNLPLQYAIVPQKYFHYLTPTPLILKLSSRRLSRVLLHTCDKYVVKMKIENRNMIFFKCYTKAHNIAPKRQVQII